MKVLSTELLRKNQGIALPLILGLSILAPNLYHMLGMKGVIFLPIFLGTVVACYTLSFKMAMLVAGAAPLLNYLMTGMPPVSPMPMLQILTFEGLVLAGSLYTLKNKHMVFGPLAAILIARVSTLSLVFFYSGVTLDFWRNGFIMGLPGIALNLTLAVILSKLVKS